MQNYYQLLPNQRDEKKSIWNNQENEKKIIKQENPKKEQNLWKIL